MTSCKHRRQALLKALVCVVLAETERRIGEEEAAKEELSSREERPKDLLSELSSSCRTYLPDQLKLAKRSHQTLRPPIAACKLKILREEEGAADCATLQIQVCPLAFKCRAESTCRKSMACGPVMCSQLPLV